MSNRNAYFAKLLLPHWLQNVATYGYNYMHNQLIYYQLYMLIPSHTILPHWESWNIPYHTGASENEAFLVDMQYWYSNHMEIYDDNPPQVVIWAWCHIMQPGFPQNAEHFHNPWVEAQHAEARLLNHPRPSHCSHQVEQES